MIMTMFPNARMRDEHADREMESIYTVAEQSTKEHGRGAEGGRPENACIVNSGMNVTKTHRRNKHATNIIVVTMRAYHGQI